MILQVGVKALIQNDAGKYLFIRRVRTMDNETEPHWDIPGGRIKPEEELTAALAREIDEETGMTLEGTPDLLAAQDIIPPGRNLHVVRLTYRAHAKGEPKLSQEHQELSWMTREEALDANLDKYIREII
jgi:8-oxo-dGTP diphosphatase